MTEEQKEIARQFITSAYNLGMENEFRGEGDTSLLEEMQRRHENFITSLLVKPKRTLTQNRALHKDFDLIAEKLNDAGYSIQKTVRMDIDWSGWSVKEYLWRPIQSKFLGKDSTTELEKHGDIEKVHDMLMRELGTRCGIEYHEFPNDPKNLASN